MDRSFCTLGDQSPLDGMGHLCLLHVLRIQESYQQSRSLQAYVDKLRLRHHVQGPKEKRYLLRYTQMG
ncbi:Uncharacterised protein [Vibrio cholerae]|nr:Uncharacterised protein [Vibrio cholerae]